MAPFRLLCLLTVLVQPLTFPRTAAALTAKDVTDKMSKEERFGYLSGIIDTLSYDSLLNGDRTKAVCISNMFYKNNDGASRMIDMLHAFPDKPPVAILIVAVKKECAK